MIKIKILLLLMMMILLQLLVPFQPPLFNYNTMGPGPGLVARVLWLYYCMRLASSGVGGVRRVWLALLYVGSCVGVLWMFWMRLASSGVGGMHRAPSEG